MKKMLLIIMLAFVTMASTFTPAEAVDRPTEQAWTEFIAAQIERSDIHPGTHIVYPSEFSEALEIWMQVIVTPPSFTHSHMARVMADLSVSYHDYLQVSIWYNRGIEYYASYSFATQDNRIIMLMFSEKDRQIIISAFTPGDIDRLRKRPSFPGGTSL